MLNNIINKILHRKKTNKKKATSRELVGWTILLILAIVVLVIIAHWLLGDYTKAGESVINSIKSRFIGAGL